VKKCFKCLTYSPWSTVPSRKLTVAHLVKKTACILWNLMLHYCLPVFLRSILILCSNIPLGLPGFPPKTPHAFLFPLMLAANPVPLILLDYTSQQKLVRSANHESPHYVIFLASCYFIFRKSKSPPQYPIQIILSLFSLGFIVLSACQITKIKYAI